jgi:RNA polymerase sigma-70 factor (ECF subfamily)
LAAEASIGDEALLRRAVEGDDSAFSALVRRHEDRIFSLCLRMMRERSDAFDATQETFLMLFRKGSTFSGDSAFSTWLYRVAVNVCNDLLRKRARTPLLEREEEAPERPDQHDPEVSELVTMRLDLRRALQELPEDYREAVAMHDLGGVPYEEIAKATGVAVGTVKSRISRGRKQLARILEQPQVAEPSKEER